MEKLTDYIRWIGDLDFRAYPFRDADAVVLCNISYFDLHPVFADGKPEHTVSDCLPMIEAGEAKLLITGGDLGNLAIFAAAARSARFGSLRISDYEDVLREEPPLQFSAMTFHAQEFSFIAYRGTDASIAGWHENCMISFMKTEAQQLSLVYAERVIGDGIWYIGGHSKGANHAQFAACLLPESQWEKVEHVYLLDGPGFCPEVMDPRLDQRIDPKTTRIVPEFDVIGKLFEPQITDTKIVRSWQTGIMQHSLATWLIEHGSFATVEKNDPDSALISRMINEWAADIPQEDRPVFLKELFEAVSADGTKNLEDLDADRLESILIKLTGAGPTTQKTFAKLTGRLFFDDALPLPESKTEKLKRTFSDLRVQGAALILAGVILFLLSGILLEATTVAIAAALTVLQTVLLIRRLIRQRGGSDGIRGRLIILAAILAFGAMLFLKDRAMFVIGSVLYGVLCLILSYYAVSVGFKRKTWSFLRILNFAEGAGAVLFGIGFLMIPQRCVRVFAIMLAACVAFDGLLRLGSWFMRRIFHGRRRA